MKKKVLVTGGNRSGKIEFAGNFSEFCFRPLYNLRLYV